MLKKITMSLVAAFIINTDVLADPCLIPASDPQLCETKEILFNSGDASVVTEKANELGSAVAIYEYLRNNADYMVYHGARSSSLNSILALRGNDVDLASSLIAMLRTQNINIKTRYAVGNIKIPKTELANWLGVLDNDLAVAILGDQGIQNIDASDPNDVVFEHVWVQALVNYNNYRAGNSVSSVACVTEGGSCQWISLDVSYKQRNYKNSYKTLLRNVNFDYAAYYNAENPGSPDYVAGLKNKNPLEIYEEQALTYLRANHPGVTLEDVIDKGEIITDNSGLLPASLPYEVVGTVATYNSVEDYDLASATDWTKYLTSTAKICNVFNVVTQVSLAELSTKKLTVTLFDQGSGLVFGHRLDGVNSGGTLNINGSLICNGVPVVAGFPVDIDLEIDAIPGAATPIQVAYNNLSIGGYYLIASGGETSNWTQVKRAYNELLAADETYPIVVDNTGALGNGIDAAYVDENTNDVADVGDSLLIENLAAQDALTGGLLYVAQNVYYTRLREESERYSALKGVVSPIAAYLGVISTTQEVEYLDNVPFAITPGGLLIDLKGINLNGTWEVDQPAIYSSDAFKFIGHHGSSLEHEIWQEITGYDAISTMRGIQFATSQGHQLLDIENSTTVDTFPPSLSSLGFANQAPADYTKNEYTDVFGRHLVGWNYTGPNPTTSYFHVFKPDIEGLVNTDPQTFLTTYQADNDIDAFFSSYDNNENLLIAAQASEGQLKTNQKATGSSASYATFDVINATVTSPTGFALGSYNRISSTAYDFFINETLNHADGVYPVTVTTDVADSSDTRPYSVNLGAAYTVIAVNVKSPTGFTVGSNFTQPNASGVMTLTVSESGGHANGNYNIVVDIVVTVGTFQNVALSPAIQIIGNRFVDGQITFPFSPGIDVSDNQTLTCNDGSQFTANPTQLLVDYENCFNNDLVTNVITNFVDFLDVGLGFDPNTYAYRDGTINIDDYDTAFINQIRSDMYFVTGGRLEYIMPNKLPQDTNYLFGIHVKNTYGLSDDLASSTYAITNYSCRLLNPIPTSCSLQTAGGGYVTAAETIVPAISNDFNNEIFTDQNVVAIASNDIIRTPSTSDPVSTVTGNMYHDETDIVISGKGLNYAFTRTYNSDQVKNATTNTPLSKGWTHSYNMSLKANDYGQHPNSTTAPENANGTTSSITYVDERGGESNYLVDDIGATYAVTAPHMTFDTMELDTPAAGQYTLTFRNGTKYIFTGSDLKVPGNTARLTTIEDPYGRQLNFAYTGNSLTSITDNLSIPGRTGLTLSYFVGGANEGLLDTVTDWTGRVWDYQYTNAQLTSVINPLTDTMVYTYSAENGLLQDITHPQVRAGKQKTMQFGYYENNQAYNYIDDLGNEESLTYDLFRKRTRITNPRGFITEHLYDENGAMVKLVEPDDGILLFENSTDGLRYKKTDAIGNPTTYAYNLARTLDGAITDSFGQVTREQDALGNTTDYTYGLYDQITEINDKRSVINQSEYYATTNAGTGALMGKLQRVVMPVVTVNGSTQNNVVLAEYQYNIDGTVKRIEEMIDPATPSRKRISDITYTYNAAGYTVTTVTTGATSGGSITTIKQFDNLWRLTSETINRRTSATNATIIALTTSYEYDNLSRPTKVTDALGNIAETSYDKNGQIKQVINRYLLGSTGTDTPLQAGCTIDPVYPNHHSCNTTTRTYDANDRLLTEANIDGNTIDYQYDSMGNVTKVTNRNGHGLTNQYDAKNRLIKVTDENGHSIKTNYDLAGRVTSIKDANGNTTALEYDALGRLTKTTSAENRISTIDLYDGNGNIIRARDANALSGKQTVNAFGATTFKIYDQFNRVVTEINADNESTSYTYDLQGNLTSVTDALNHVTTFVYDDLGRLIETIDPIIEAGTDKTVTYTYDEAGNRLTMTDRLGETTRTTFDAADRVTLVEYLSDATSQTTSYDQYGDNVAIANNEVTYSYTYNNRHLMTSKTDSRNNRSLIWNYDAAGNVISKTDYQGSVTTFTYDDSNRLVAMANPAYLQASYQYDGAGRLLSRILSNGASTLYNYDKDGFLTKMTQRSADGTIIDDRTYGHDDIGNITSVTTSTETTSYVYNPVYRLLSADSTINTNDQSWTYDDVGNRLTMVQGGTTYYYNYNNNGNRLDDIRILSAVGPIFNSYDYDDNGSRVAKRDGGGSIIETYSYDQRRLISQIDADTFGYDANAYRINKTTPTATNNYLLEGENLEATYDENNTLKASYLRGVIVDEIINGFEKDTNGKLINRSFHHDQVNSVLATTDHTGAATQTNSYTPFGQTLSATGTDANALMYTGRENDSNGLYYYRARYFDPFAGRFLSEDPLGFKAGINFYAYVGNNPLNFNDPSGNITFTMEGNIHIPAWLTGLASYFGITEIPVSGAHIGVAESFPFFDGAERDSGIFFGAEIPAFDIGTGKGSLVFGIQGGSVSDLAGKEDLTVSATIIGVDAGFTVNSKTGDFQGIHFGEGLGLNFGATLNYTSVLSENHGLITPDNNAAGGFVLYPNKINTNQIESVYAK